MTDNDIITIVGPTAKQPQLENLHSSGLGTKGLGTTAGMDARQKAAGHRKSLGLTQSRDYVSHEGWVTTRFLFLSYI